MLSFPGIVLGIALSSLLSIYINQLLADFAVLSPQKWITPVSICLLFSFFFFFLSFLPSSVGFSPCMCMCMDGSSLVFAHPLQTSR